MPACPACGEQNRDGARFCNACGAPLAPVERGLEEERKTVTVVFVDLVGFTAQAERLDPEDVRAVLAPYHSRVRAELERHGGTVEKFIGDAVMAVFGAPVVHEDDPERAVRAAIAIRDWVDDEADGLQLRLGVNTGEVLVTLGARPREGEGMVAGDVVNTAARLQAAAPANGILVGEQTYRATLDVFEYAESEPVVAKGKGEPVAAWVPLRARGRLGVDLAQRPVAPLMGRQRELELLVSTLARVREERSPQLVTLVGVPGIGKSRLVRELAEAADREQELVTWRQGQSLPYGDGVTFWALGEIVKEEAGILESDPAEAAAAKLRSTLRELASDEEESRWLEPHLRPLLGLGEEAARAGEPFEAWRRFLEALADRRPLVLVFEDLHWADEALLDFVDELVDLVVDVPLLVLGTARPELLERRPGWGGGKPNAVTLSLPPLAGDGVARLLAVLLDRPVIDAGEQEELLSKIGGNPLYAEQYARALIEQRQPDDLPETVHGIIAARIDALSDDEKRLLQDAAVVGRVFWTGALGTIGGSSQPVDDVLRRLERKQFVQRARASSLAGEGEYAFRHVLLRDVAYGQIPRAARAEKHLRAAEWLEGVGRVEDHAELLAEHYLSAIGYLGASGDVPPGALRALREAGDRAALLAGYAAAVRFYRAALELSPPDGTERAGLLLRLGRARFSAESAGREELEAAYDAACATGDNEVAAEAALGRRMIAWYDGDGAGADRWLNEALELVRDRPDSAVKTEALTVEGGTQLVKGNFADAIRLGREALPLAERLGLEAFQARIFGRIGTARVALGDPGGVEDLERGLKIARRIGSYAELHATWNNLSESLFLLGRVDEAARSYEALIESLERFARDTDRRWGRAAMGALHECEGRWDEALSLLDPYLAEIDSGAPHYLESPARCVRATIRLGRDDLPGATADAERAVAAGRAAGDPQVLAPALAISGVVLMTEGKREEAERYLDELLAFGTHLPALTSGFGTSLVEVAWLARDLGRDGRLVQLLADAPALPWITVARAVAGGDLERAATVLADVGSPPVEAYTRLRTAAELSAAGDHEGAAANLELATSFYGRVGAAYYLRRCEAVGAQLGPRASSARNP